MLNAGEFFEIYRDIQFLRHILKCIKLNLIDYLFIVVYEYLYCKYIIIYSCRYQLQGNQLDILQNLEYPLSHHIKLNFATMKYNRFMIFSIILLMH
jgi:hypothetical protein